MASLLIAPLAAHNAPLGFSPATPGGFGQAIRRRQRLYFGAASSRRLAKDVEATIESAVSWLFIARVKLMSRRLVGA